MINQTFELRKNHGKFESLESDFTDSKRNHVSNCEACGSIKPEKLFGVKSKTGLALLVGSKCFSILTSNKNPNVDSVLLKTGEIYQDGEKTYVYITDEWLKNLGDYIFVTGKRITRFGDSIESCYPDYNGAYHTGNYNPFFHNVYEMARKNGKITIKQFNAVNESIK